MMSNPDDSKPCDQQSLETGVDVLRKLNSSSEHAYRLLLAFLLIIAGALIVWWQWPTLISVFQNEEKLLQLVEDLGWFGPLALILFNILQIVIAPIPGYFVQAAAGYLYGPYWGGLWATIGLMCGSMLAMGLTRRFGRPLAISMIGSDRLEQWEATTHSTSYIVWFLLIFAPLGDIPYFLAGLSRVNYHKIALLTFVIRTPTVFAWAAIGAGVVVLTWWQWVALFALLGLLLLLFLRYQERLMRWIDKTVHKQLRQENQV